MALRNRLAEAAKKRFKSESAVFLGETVELRGMTVGQRSHVMEVGYTKGPKPTVVYGRFYPAILIAGIYDPETGQPALTEQDAEMINGLPTDEVDPIAKVILRLSGMDKEAPAAVGKDSGETADDS